MEKYITCSDCREEFVWSEKEQDFYAEQGFTAPKRCKECREIRKQNKQQGR